MKKVLLAGVGQFENFAPACARALGILGLEVTFFDGGPFFPPTLPGRIQSHLMAGPAVWRLNQALLRLARKVRPELTLIHTGYSIHPGTVKTLSRSCWVAGIYPDDPFGPMGKKPYFHLFRAAIPYYNSHHSLIQEHVTEFGQMGVRYVRQLLAYFVPWLHYPSEKTGTDAPIDAVFVGHCEPDQRIRYVSAIVEGGIALRIFGGAKDWRRHLPASILKRLPAIQMAVGEHYCRVLSRAKIGLAFYSGGNRARHTFRVFEIPACGSFLLAERTDLMETLYEEGKEAEFFSSPKELLDKIRFYLKNDPARARIAARGHERCMRGGYDVVSRMKQCITDIHGFVSDNNGTAREERR